MNPRIAALALILTAGPAHAQFESQGRAGAPVDSSVQAPSGGIQANLGPEVPMGQGPWVVGEVLLFSGPKLVTDPLLRDRIRARRGMLYTRSDIDADVGTLKSLASLEDAKAAVHGMPELPVPSEFAAVAASTFQVRLVYVVRERALPPALAAAPGEVKTPPAAVSGVVFTPTAYRGAGRFATPGLGLDFNASYFIGRLYGKNTFANSVRKSSYIDRLGVWILTADGKMQVQSEGDWRPAMAVGTQGVLLFRDAPQPTITTPAVSVKVSQKTTKILSDAYVVASKKIWKIRTSAGFMQGSFGDSVGHLSEYLTPEALDFYAGRRGDRSWSRSMPFVNLLYLPKPEYPLAVEFIKFNGAALNPWMLNFKLGYFLKMNFDVSYLKFNGGQEYLGTIQFRYNQFPRK